MFFAPPKVKSLSKYADFGVYLEHKHFLIMLGAAILVHAGVIGVYSLMPREEVIKIPVRALNIKLGDGNGGNVIEMAPPEPAVTSGVTMSESQAEEPAGKPAAKSVQPAKDAKPAIYADSHRRTARARQNARNESLASSSGSLSVPKQYVRAGEMAGEGGAGTSSGSVNGNSEASEEAEQRYEQTISQRFESNKIYPQEAKQQGIEGKAIVWILISREGRIIDSAIQRSSGSAIIDKAAINMVRTSSLPPVPDDYPKGTQFEFFIPVSFTLQ